MTSHPQAENIRIPDFSIFQEGYIPIFRLNSNNNHTELIPNISVKISGELLISAAVALLFAGQSIAALATPGENALLLFYF